MDVHLHNTVQCFLRVSLKSHKCVWGQPNFLPKALTKRFRESFALPSYTHFKTSHKYDYVHLTIGLTPRPLEKVQIVVSVPYVLAATRCQHWDRHQIHDAVDACLRTKAHTWADGCLWEQDRTPSAVVYLLCQTAESHQAAVGSIKNVAGRHFTMDHT